MKTRSKSDLILINNIKKGKDIDKSLMELISRHSGIYVNMIEAFAAKTSNYINYNELIEEKDYHIYKSVLKFDCKRGTKFSTHLGNETRWMCLNLYNKNKKNNENMEARMHACIIACPSLKNPNAALLRGRPSARACSLFGLRFAFDSRLRLCQLLHSARVRCYDGLEHFLVL